MDREKCYISNIVFDTETNRSSRNGRDYSVHIIIGDRAFEDGKTEHKVVCLLNQREYDELQELGFYYVYFNEKKEG